jgi:hypothetical protein
MDFIHLAKSILVGLFGTIICKGVLLLLRRRGIRPEKWVAAMIQSTTHKVADERWIAWIACGVLGILSVMVWDAFHFDERISNIWNPAPPLKAEFLVAFISKRNDNAGLAWLVTTIDGAAITPVPLFLYITLYNTTEHTIIPKSFALYTADGSNGPWKGTCEIDLRENGKLVFHRKTEMTIDNDIIHGVLGSPIPGSSYAAGWIAASCKGGMCGKYLRISVIDFANIESVADASIFKETTEPNSGMGAYLHTVGPVQIPENRHIVDECR